MNVAIPTKPSPLIHRKISNQNPLNLKTTLPIQVVDSSLQDLQLNFKNQIFHSFVTEFARDENDSGLSVKLAINGLERYRIGSRMHNVNSGRFLVVNQHQNFECRVKSKDIVEGLCFYLDPKIVREIQACHHLGNSGMLDQEDKCLSLSPVFTEKVFGLSESPLGEFLQQMLPVLRDPQMRAKINYDLFFTQMAEALLKSEKRVNRLMNNLKNEKSSTREELYRRVSLARIYIDEHYLEDLNLNKLAEIAMTSKYHFLRSFKEIYHASPYQFVLKKRLKYGAELLKQGNYKLSEIAAETGFTDRRAFNKSFRSHFGVLPSEYGRMC